MTNSTEAVTRLRECLNDLRGFMAPPALWTGGTPPRSVRASLDALSDIANELEERVALHTRELATATEALTDVTERMVAEEALNRARSISPMWRESRP